MSSHHTAYTVPTLLFSLFLHDCQRHFIDLLLYLSHLFCLGCLDIAVRFLFDRLDHPSLVLALFPHTFLWFLRWFFLVVRRLPYLYMYKALRASNFEHGYATYTMHAPLEISRVKFSEFLLALRCGPLNGSAYLKGVINWLDLGRFGQLRMRLDGSHKVGRAISGWKSSPRRPAEGRMCFNFSPISFTQIRVAGTYRSQIRRAGKFCGLFNSR